MIIAITTVMVKAVVVVTMAMALAGRQKTREASHQGDVPVGGEVADQEGTITKHRTGTYCK